jgi:hypothetical protein
MKTMRAFAAMLLAGAALVVAGCGGSGASNASSVTADSASSASLAPKNAGLWVSVDTDRSSSQWQALDAVLGRIPGAQALVDDALAQIGSASGSTSGGTKLDFRRDIQPALGKEVVVVLPSGAADPVLLAKPDDPGKLDALLGRADSGTVKGERDGWTVVAPNQKALDAYDAAGSNGSLADSDSFRKAMNGLPGDALVRAYADADGLAGAAGNASGVANGALKTVSIPGLGNLTRSQAASSVDPKALANIGIVGLTASAGDHIVRVDGNWQAAKGANPAEYTPALLDRVPADALAAVSFSGSQFNSDQIRSTLEQAGATQLDQLQQTLGVTLDDLLHVVDGEGVLYVRPGLIVPEVTAVAKPSDVERALATIDEIVTRAAGSQGAKITETDQGGVHWKQVNVSIVSIAWGRDGDRLVVTTQPQGLGAFDGNEAKLVGSARFKTAAADVGFADKTNGFAYVDVKGLTPLVKTIAAAASSGSATSDPTFDKVVQALDAIDTVAVNSTADGQVFHFQAAVRVR